MKNSSLETAVGFFVIIGILCVGYLTIKLGKMDWFGDDNYQVYAQFESVSGLKTGAVVEMAGVEIGQVDSIELDKETKVALVKLKIRDKFSLADDVIASVSTAGLIGDKYIKLSPGASDESIRPGGMITDTESAIDIEALISKYIFGSV